MNCEQIKDQVSIRQLLESFNIFPVKENRKTAFYYALDREEKIPSFSVDYIKNKGFDFGTGKIYDVISIVQVINKCSVSEALKYLQRFNFSLQEDKVDGELLKTSSYHILKVSEIRHAALVQYLQSRKVLDQKDLVKEIHYEMNGKKYFGIGFFNISGGVEVRNKYAKLCLGRKDVTLIKNDLNTLREVIVFEGFFDFLTYLTIKNFRSETADYLILNSTAMFFKVENELKDYHKISLFLDNDSNGKTNKENIQKNYKNVEDCSLLYLGFKDLNEWFCNY
ncbi:toprim domain-containing protein [Epilithonimonas ginsengisoli]|uniref:Toprim domain-containing protein n=1 Tax=Epilithonimonas ginsengisoli TaxID=1245592 RepID=A0ABU4JIA3_9FLAO|nr:MULTISPECIES: toprim domain-containing protein [Chryseobacterium group]MBV6878815.1 toprim domain-containing protein [Epilithonimonas sp. FP105]MDW8549418.1 toprim domain-containing protein [Epilithonimonas ginsengisoli]OAH71700.1 DNA primase [Chryseobacterium sp. FP211-J200]HBV17502.1 DNA primase [Chryseobacterium carnipullorum]